jgi:hypothetical protein
MRASGGRSRIVSWRYATRFAASSIALFSLLFTHELIWNAKTRRSTRARQTGLSKALMVAVIAAGYVSKPSPEYGNLSRAWTV